MKKFLTALPFIAAIILYAAYLKHEKNETEAVGTLQASVDTSSTADMPLTTAPASASTTSSPVATTPVPTPSTPVAKYKDGTYTGVAADAFYGNIQVKAIVTDGKLTDVVFLQYPNDRGTSIEINTQAMPILKQEAIKAQSASVSGVSGASDSSRAFRTSLTSALQQAS